MFVSPFRSFETIPHETAPTLKGLDGEWTTERIDTLSIKPNPLSPRGRGASLRYAAICYGGKKAAAFVLLYSRAPHENCSSRRGDMKPPQQHTPTLQTDRQQQDNKTKTPSPSHPTPSLAPPPRTRTARLVARQPRPTEPGPHPDRQKPLDRAARRRCLHRC